MKFVCGILFSCLFVRSSLELHPPSPCPNVFNFEGSEPENNRWYAEISLRTEESLVGIRLDLEFDRPSELLVSWSGQVSASSNMKYTILNLNQRLKPGTSALCRIMLKYNPSGGIPNIRYIRLNGRQICPEDSIYNSYGESRPPQNNYNGRPDPVFGENEGNTYPIDGNNNPTNTVSLQANPDTNSQIHGVINEFFQNENPNDKVIITVVDSNGNQQTRPIGNNNGNQQGRPTTIDNNQQNRPIMIDNNQQNRPSTINNNQQNRPITPSANRPVINSNPSRPSSNNRPSTTTEQPSRPINNNNQGGNSFNSGGNSQQFSSSSSLSCGEVKLAVPLVTAGQATLRGQWPWHVALYMIEGINLSYHCGGSLVARNKIITAAHCVTNRQNDAVVQSNKIVIYLGKYHQLQYSDELGVQTKQVVRVNVFPSYNSSNYLGDIAILTLSSNVEYTNFVRPVCLWDGISNNLDDLVDKEGTVVGWGYDENDTPTEELKMAKMPVVSHQTCLWSYPKFYSEFTSDKTFCAGFRNGTSVCNGDSGGGMVFNRDSRWYLRGIVSITVAKEGLRVCDTRHYVVFTDVAKYIDFVKKNLQS